MIDAPRKIWATTLNPGGWMLAALKQHHDTLDLYHHDDVVRGLVRELQAALDYFDHHGITGGSVETTRAALSKIAEDAP